MWARQRPDCQSIPGLNHCMYKRSGGRKNNQKFQIIHSNLNENGVDYAWKFGKDFNMTAVGSMAITHWNSQGMPIPNFEAFKVSCTCRNVRKYTQKYIKHVTCSVVCCHVESALDSVVDQAIIEASYERRKAKDKVRLETQLEEQKERSPEGFKRLQHGLQVRSAQEIVNLSKERMATASVLEGLLKALPVEVIPLEKLERCGRCKTDYDPQIPSQRICAEEHSFGRMINNFISRCSNCDMHYMDQKDSTGIHKYCYEGVHIPEAEYDGCDDHILRELTYSRIENECPRCWESWIMGEPDSKPCRMKHPQDKIKHHRDKYDRTWDSCRMCRETFNLMGFDVRNRGENDPTEMGEFCYELPHVERNTFKFKSGEEIIEELTNELPQESPGADTEDDQSPPAPARSQGFSSTSTTRPRYHLNNQYTHDFRNFVPNNGGNYELQTTHDTGPPRPPADSHVALPYFPSWSSQYHPALDLYGIEATQATHFAERIQRNPRNPGRIMRTGLISHQDQHHPYQHQSQ